MASEVASEKTEELKVTDKMSEVRVSEGSAGEVGIVDSEAKGENKGDDGRKVNGIEANVELTKWAETKLKSLKSKEEEALKALRAIYAQKKPKLSSDTNTLLRFLQARSFSVSDAELMLENHLKWRKETFPIKRSSFEKEKFVLNGCAYAHGVDTHGNPILIVRSSLFTPKERDVEACLRYTVFMLTYTLQFHSKTGRFTVLYDRDNFSLKKNLDMDLMRGLGKVMSDNYPEVLNKTYVCPTGTVFRGIWNVVKYFFDPKTRSKVQMLSSTKDYVKYVSPENLQKRYSGTSSYEFKFNPSDYPEEIGTADPWE